MKKEYKYVYCIIGTKQERNFGPIGIGDRNDEVLTIGYDDLSMVISSYPETKIPATHDNLLTHEKVIEKVMKDFDSVLPIRFGTLASGADEIRNLLDRRNKEFKSVLRDIDHKIELGVKGIWKNMVIIFNEIVAENEEIKEAKEKIQNETSEKNFLRKFEVGKMVAQVLSKKQTEEAEKIVDILRKTSIDYKLNKIFGDEMFMNAAFLVDKGREKEFDNIMENLGEEFKNRIKFMYAGPLPVFNFVNIVIHPEEWEK